MIDYEYLINQTPGYFLWKDINSVYLHGCEKTAKLFGFKTTDQLIGITDFEINCEAANYADLFVRQDEKLKQQGKSITVVDIHPYVGGEIKTLLINKIPIRNEEQEIIGVSCHCLEITEKVVKEMAMHLAKTDAKKTRNRRIKSAANYYLNSEYGDLSLSPRQAQCLFYLLRGKSMKDIAKIFNLSPRTIESYLNEIKSKMGCASKKEIIEKSFELEFTEIVPVGILDVFL